MENAGIQPVMPIGGYGYGDGWGGGAGCFMWVILLFALMGGGGFGGWNNRGMATQADVYAANDAQDMKANQRQIMSIGTNLGNGIADATFALNNTINAGHNALGRDIANGTYVMDKSVTDARYMLGNAINENRFAAKDNACVTNRNIDQLRFDNQIGMQGIQAAIHAEGEETRKLITQNQMEALKMALAEKDRHLQTAEFALSQQNQTYTIKNDVINAVRPFPGPAYIVGNPYGAGCNCGCGVYNG